MVSMKNKIAVNLSALKEICESIKEKQEKVLVFTQFREIIPALHDFLSGVFGQEGLTLHGQTAIKNRAKLVDAFQQEQGIPVFCVVSESRRNRT
jgi:SNF2 family DNA or RNA helicase